MMKRSSSWPQLKISEQDDVETEVVIETLRQKVSDFQRQISICISYIENLNSEKANLQILNKNLIENNRLCSHQILNLEDEKYRLMLQLKRAENLIEVLQQDLEKVDREKIAISKELGMQQQAFEIMDNSRKEVKKRMEMFREATARDRNLIESKALEDLGCLRNQLQALELQLKEKEELQLKEKEEAAQLVETFAIENKKQQIRNKGLIKQNIAIKRQLNELQERLEMQKEQNLLLHQEVENMKLQNTCSIWLNSLRLEPQSIELSSSAIGSHFSILTTQRDEKTPSYYLPDYDEQTSVSCRPSEYEQQLDPLDEYIRLAVKAVQIQFPNLTVSSERLMEKAKMVPFYKVHEHLSSYMRQLEYMESFQKEREKQHPASVSHRPTMLAKARAFFGCGVLFEESKDYQCNALEQRWLRKKNRSALRVGF